MTVISRPQSRAGLSLLEVLTALAIFLMAMVAVGQMINMATDSAIQVEHQQLAAQLCQAKIAEVNAGAIALSAQSDAQMGDEFPGWTWSMEAEQGDIANLWRVKVKVGRDGPNGTRTECEMNQMVLDPAIRGNASDNPATASASADTAATTSATSSSTSSGSTGSGGSTGGSSGSTQTGSSGGSSVITKTGSSSTSSGGSSGSTKTGTTGGTPSPTTKGGSR